MRDEPLETFRGGNSTLGAVSNVVNDTWVVYINIYTYNV